MTGKPRTHASPPRNDERGYFDSAPTLDLVAIDHPYRRLPKVAVVTGAAGFIGSHLVEALLNRGVEVRGLDNMSTGSEENLADIARRAGRNWHRFELITGDIRSPDDCEHALRGADTVFHEAALNSVPRSLQIPITVAENNVLGMATLLHTAVSVGVERFIFASSSSVYGNVPDMVRREDLLGVALSPYAASKQAAESFARCYHEMGNISVTGLRYFNVFGPRQNPHGPYSAVVPRWIQAMTEGRDVQIYGDGKQQRDFTHVANIVHANLLACDTSCGGGEIFNVGTQRAISLLDLFDTIKATTVEVTGSEDITTHMPSFTDERPGDVRSASADLTKINTVLGYGPVVDFTRGMQQTVGWFVDHQRS
ncbi:NAD-dependent epimerase/dehydratase family protein [Nocardia carnea]|uniref:NAD-dependent epimerase/dehydratase family protein n=1 Tax=Nocardia carnea TaxID=37328 RepID=UPI002458B4DA|nr:NAD-dependent epimerase/dehydratase family protein [Nocardia carnea]